MNRIAGISAIDSVDQILEDFGAYIFLDKIAKQLARHPFLAFGASALIISITLPFIIFMIFAIATVILTFFGFVIVEGKENQIKNSLKIHTNVPLS